MASDRTDTAPLAMSLGSGPLAPAHDDVVLETRGYRGRVPTRFDCRRLDLPHRFLVFRDRGREGLDGGVAVPDDAPRGLDRDAQHGGRVFVGLFEPRAAMIWALYRSSGFPVFLPVSLPSGLSFFEFPSIGL